MPCSRRCAPDVSAHREVVRRDEDQPDVTVVLHQISERARGASPAEIAHQADDLAVDSAAAFEAALQGVDVEQRLGRVLILAAAGIDDRDRSLDAVHQRRGLGRHPRFTGAHDDHVDVRAEGADAVFEALALDLRRGRRIANLARAHPQEVTGIVERKEGPRGGLGEVEHRPLVGQQRLQRASAEPGFRVLAQPGGQGTELVEQGPVELPRIEDVERAIHQTCSSGAATWRRKPSRSASRASHASTFGVAGPGCPNIRHRCAAAPAGMSPIEKRSPAT